MKREAQKHPKVTRLARELEVWPVTACGIVANLWLQTATHKHRGDIGRWPNWQIAEAIGYPGDPDQLVAALVKCRLLDEIAEDEGRLYVHDWHEHAEDWVHLRIARNHELFANGSRPKLTRLSAKARAEIEAAYDDAQVQPCAHICAHERTSAHIRPLPKTQDLKPKTLEAKEDLSKKTHINPEREIREGGTGGETSPGGSALAPLGKLEPDPWRGDSPPGFAEFWGAYPRKKKRKDALAAWRKIRPSPEALAEILAGLERHKLEDSRFRDLEFTPYPASWLRQESWTEPAEAVGNSPPRGASLAEKNQAAVAEAIRKHSAGGRIEVPNLRLVEVAHG